MWVFQELLELLQPASADGTIHGAMIAAQGNGKVIALLPALLGILVGHNARLDTTNGQDARLWWIDDGTELVYA